MQNTEKLSITIPTRYAAIVRDRVEAGDYASSSEVIHEALRVWKDYDEVRQKCLKALKADIDEAYAEEGEALSAEAVFTELEKGV